MTAEVALSLPFAGRWLAQNSPARRVPSHGTDLLGGRYAIDFVGVDHRRRTADRRDWRTFLATEPPSGSSPTAARSWPPRTASSSTRTTASPITWRAGRS